jgi:hypothetical protein
VVVVEQVVQMVQVELLVVVELVVRRLQVEAADQADHLERLV